MASKHDPTVTWKDLTWIEKYIPLIGIVVILVIVISFLYTGQ